MKCVVTVEPQYLQPHLGNGMLHFLSIRVEGPNGLRHERRQPIESYWTESVFDMVTKYAIRELKEACLLENQHGVIYPETVSAAGRK